jgi:hypothetical protein
LLRSSDRDDHLAGIRALSDLGKLALPALPALESYPYDDVHPAVWSIKEDAGMH